MYDPFTLWLIWWWGGFLIMTFVWWYHHNDLTTGMLVLFVFGTSFMGPLLLIPHLTARRAEMCLKREPTILIRGRGK